MTAKEDRVPNENFITKNFSVPKTSICLDDFNGANRNGRCIPRMYFRLLVSRLKEDGRCLFRVICIIFLGIRSIITIFVSNTLMVHEV